MEHQLVDGDVLAQTLGVSRSTLWRLRRQGLPCTKVGRSLRFPVEEVHAWLKEQPQAEPAQLGIFRERPPAQPEGELLPCHWSPSVALDPRHRPQVPGAPSSTVRKDWRKYPQEAHLLDVENHRFRRLTEDEIAVLQGFPRDWASDLGLSHRERIAGLGNAVPPPLGAALYQAMASMLASPARSAVEICAGFGGLALGAHSVLGLEHLALIEFWDAAVRVLRASTLWESRAVHLCDVKAFDWSALAGQVDILSGGPPCQPWSLAGLSRGADDERDLLCEMPGLVETLRPKAFMFENVPGLMSEQHRPYLHKIIDRLRAAGGAGTYGVAVGILQAADFGVPQRRQRVVIAGIRGASDGAVHDFFDRVYALRTHADPRRGWLQGKAPWVTFGEALPDWSLATQGWHRWIDTPERQRMTNGEADPITAATPAASASPEVPRPASRTPLMGLVWPGRGRAVDWQGGSWSVTGAEDSLVTGVLPLLPLPSSSGRALSDPWYVRGNHVQALEALRPALGRQAKVVYFEPARLKTDLADFAVEDAQDRLNTWLTVVQATLRRALSLLRDDGVLAVITGVTEQPYLQVMLDEMLGPKNRVGTVVWQKGYSVQGQNKDKPKKEFYDTHDYVVVYSRRREECLSGAALRIPPQNFSNSDGDPRGPWKAEQKGANYYRESSDFSVNLPPYRWSLVGGELPPGFWRISPKSGVIWAPGRAITEAGKWSVIVQVEDKAGAKARREFKIEVSSDAAAPSPAPPPWLIARDGNGAPTNDDGVNAPAAGGALRWSTAALPAGRVGSDYFACLQASGGTPWSGTTRPGKTSSGGNSRYWDVSFQTLEAAAAADSVDFKDNDNSIPAVKVHLGGSSFTYLNQTTTWRGDGKGKKGAAKDPMRVGWGEDAKEELDTLMRLGHVSKVVNIGKPMGLVSRLLGLFTNEGDTVIDIGSPTAEMASVACQLGRAAVYVEMPGSDEDGELIRMPRLTCAARGAHPLPEGVIFTAARTTKSDAGYFVGAHPRAADAKAGLVALGLGGPFLDAGDAVARVRYDAYPSGSDGFLQALASVEGLVWVAGQGGDFARSRDGRLLGVHVTGRTVLDGRTLKDILDARREHLSISGNRVRIYFHRGHEDLVNPGDAEVDLRQIPFGLVMAAGGWQ